jgi:hypothetical protein
MFKIFDSRFPVEEKRENSYNYLTLRLSQKTANGSILAKERVNFAIPGSS